MADVEKVADEPSAAGVDEGMTVLEHAEVKAESPKGSPQHSISLKHTLENRQDGGEVVESSVQNASEGGPSEEGSLRKGLNVGVGLKPPVGLAIPPRLFKPVSVALSPSMTFARLQEARDERSAQTPTPRISRRHRSFKLPYLGEVTTETAKNWAKEWLRNPKNIALLIWLIGVIVSGAILFMVMVGMLNAVIPKKSDRNTWFEVSNQVINALFTLMVLYLHPTRILHLVWLIRWRPTDILNLRSVYCKRGMRKPHEWRHMLVVVLLLHLNCFAQYALCGLNWGYKRANRPFYGVAICLLVSFGAAAVAGMYNSISPLGRDFVPEEDEDESAEEAAEMAENGEVKAPPTLFHMPRKYLLLEKRMTFASREGKVIEDPEWQGGLFDCCEAPKITAITTCCIACVLGYNLDRLGFGNRYVHIVTFLLVCFAPFLVFDIAAINLDNKVIRDSLAGAGVVLCVFGLLYGGFWRIRIRQRYHLPAKTWCCGQPNMTDCTQWLFCSCCSLCQEVRTAEAFDVIDDKFYQKSMPSAESPGRAPKQPAAADTVLLTPVPASQIQPLPVDVWKIDQSESSVQAVLTPPSSQSVEP